MVRSALNTAPSIEALSQFAPLGTSTAAFFAPEELTAFASLERSGSSLPEKPVPNTASTIISLEFISSL